jgi:type IV pilus assembly protein PilN
LFDELVETIPDGAFLTKLEQQGSGLTLDGRAQSNARVSAYMRNIETSAWLGNPSLKVISNKNENDEELSAFNLNAQQVSKAKDSEQDQGSKGKGGEG